MLIYVGKLYMDSFLGASKFWLASKHREKRLFIKFGTVILIASAIMRFH